MVREGHCADPPHLSRPIPACRVGPTRPRTKPSSKPGPQIAGALVRRPLRAPPRCIRPLQALARCRRPLQAPSVAGALRCRRSLHMRPTPAKRAQQALFSAKTSSRSAEKPSQSAASEDLRCGGPARGPCRTVHLTCGPGSDGKAFRRSRSDCVPVGVPVPGRYRDRLWLEAFASL